MQGRLLSACPKLNTDTFYGDYENLVIDVDIDITTADWEPRNFLF